MTFQPYCHKVQYYETDQMSIVHHSNYFRWFEEARLDQLNQMGLNCKSLESCGIIIPVVDIQCKYLISARYDDVMTILPILTHYTGARLCYRYEVRFASSGELAATGTSTHCFVDSKFNPISLKRKAPNLHTLLSQLSEAE